MDGGQVALIGFLYQMIGTLALRVWAECPQVPIENADLDAMLGVIHGGKVYHEQGDIDALALALACRLGIDQPGACVLIQFKFSQLPEKYPVTPSDLEAICKGFLRGMQQWSQEQRSITSYCVITNRYISKELRPVMAKSKGQRTHERFNTPEILEVLQRTEILENLDFSVWNTVLERFAYEYGVDQEELEKGIDRLLGELVRRASKHQAPPIRQEDLAAAFRGYDRPRKLTVASIREHTTDDWEELKGRLGLQGIPVRRRLLTEAVEAIREHAFVAFVGPGGCGKSVAAWYLLRTMLEETAETQGSAAAFLPASDVQPYALSWIVGNWAGVSAQKRTEPMEQALRRVRIANPTPRPVLCLGLDGLDEAHETKDKETCIREIINWFWRRERQLDRKRSIEPPEAVLIITCREPVIVIDNWLDGALWHEVKSNGLKCIEVGEFSAQELLEAVEQVMPIHFERFSQALELQSTSITSIDIGRINLTLPPIHKESLDALRHPAMWYALRELSLTSEEQARLLDGNAQELAQLAEQFLVWFYEKVRKRRPNWDHVDVVEALEVVALRATAHTSQFSYSIWKDVGRRGHGLEGKQVERLYNEALSAGVIRESEPRKTWYWRHPFVGRYLAQKAREGGWYHD